VTIGATLVASLLVTLARPVTWPLALATFLLRGGIVLVLAPIVVLPSAVGLGNVLTPLLSTLVFHGFTPSITFLLAVVVGGTLAWLLGGGVVAAAAESEHARRVAADDEAWAGAASGARVIVQPAAHPAWRVLAVRLIAHLPLLLALSWGAIRIVTVAYRELSVPSDVTMPLVLRVIGAAPDAIGTVLGAWLVGETIGAIGARHVILFGERVPTALGRAVVHLVRRPLRTVALAVLPLVPLALVLIVVGLAGSATWEALRGALSFGSNSLVTLALVLLLVGLFAGGLLLIAVTSAWRGAIWTIEVARTFGASGHDPLGQWNLPADSGTLSDLRPRGVDPDTR
jgi:hypothetical protein